ncbi:hypothetical protein KIPB_009063 [Kipferlia bialata]|uniref:DML1/Misato tubulin domain-containing protein n=1 Tax=Kipferlia bialata TaxID=797122 RepID=A0A9K3D132_9EUKA|nr:hypothetical protein KIPB_009063 [Kipferlia bialata]|eukprot:g9063.t1
MQHHIGTLSGSDAEVVANDPASDLSNVPGYGSVPKPSPSRPSRIQRWVGGERQVEEEEEVHAPAPRSRYLGVDRGQEEGDVSDDVDSESDGYEGKGDPTPSAEAASALTYASYWEALTSKAKQTGEDPEDAVPEGEREVVPVFTEAYTSWGAYALSLLNMGRSLHGVTGWEYMSAGKGAALRKGQVHPLQALKDSTQMLLASSNVYAMDTPTPADIDAQPILAQFERYEQGLAVFAKEGEAVLDRVRRWAEGCDRVACTQLITSSDSGWGGMAAMLAADMVDEYSKRPLLLFDVCDDYRVSPVRGMSRAQAQQEAVKAKTRLVNRGLLLSALSEEGRGFTSMIPLSLDSLGRSQVLGLNSPLCPSSTDTSLYASTALPALAVHAATASGRLDCHRHGVPGAALTASRRLPAQLLSAPYMETDMALYNTQTECGDSVKTTAGRLSLSPYRESGAAREWLPGASFGVCGVGMDMSLASADPRDGAAVLRRDLALRDTVQSRAHTNTAVVAMTAPRVGLSPAYPAMFPPHEVRYERVAEGGGLESVTVRGPATRSSLGCAIEYRTCAGLQHAIKEGAQGMKRLGAELGYNPGAGSSCGLSGIDVCDITDSAEGLYEVAEAYDPMPFGMQGERYEESDW